MRAGRRGAVMRSVIQELGDRLVVSFRPRRMWSVLAFLSIWLTLWTFGGLMAMTQLGQVGPGGTAFFLVWLSGWAFGEFFVTGVIAWQLVGRAVLTVSDEALEIRWEIRRLARTKRFDLASVEDISASQVPSDEDEGPRSDFGLLIDANGESLHVGERLTASEAEYVATTVASRIFGRRSWWAAEGSARHAHGAAAAPVLSAGRLDIAERRAKIVGAVIAAVVIAGGTLLSAVFETRDQTRHEPQAVTIPRPRPQDFTDPRAYAAALTASTLASLRTTTLGFVECDEPATWTRWTCHVQARAEIGPYAGRTLPYACLVLETTAVTCAPESVDLAAPGSSSIGQGD
jgi:hypothetical protein